MAGDGKYRLVTDVLAFTDILMCSLFDLIVAFRAFLVQRSCAIYCTCNMHLVFPFAFWICIHLSGEITAAYLLQRYSLLKNNKNWGSEARKKCSYLFFYLLLCTYQRVVLNKVLFLAQLSKMCSWWTFVISFCPLCIFDIIPLSHKQRLYRISMKPGHNIRPNKIPTRFECVSHEYNN